MEGGVIAYWWVNHKQTFEAEVGGGYLWSPKTKKDGKPNRFYDNMLKVRPGDLVFSYADTALKALGVVLTSAASRSRPEEFGRVGEQWSEDGWYVPVDFRVLRQQLRTIDYAADLRAVLPARYSPIQENGKGNQGAYLSAVPDAMADVLF
jgi:putative restriction endonuclease